MSFPPEIWSNIFDYLTFEERLTVSLVCSSWNEILATPKFRKQIKLVFEHCKISEECPPWTTFATTNRVIYNLVLGEGVEFAANSNVFWKLIGSDIETISVHDSFHLNKDHLNLSIFPRLETLNLEGLLTCIQTYDIMYWLKDPLPNVTVIIGGPQYSMVHPETRKRLMEAKLKALNGKIIDFSERKLKNKAELFGISSEVMSFAAALGLFGSWFSIKSVNLLQISELSLKHVIGFRYNIFSIQRLNLIFSEPWNMTHLEILSVRANSKEGCFLPHAMPILPFLKEFNLHNSDSSQFLPGYNPIYELCSKCLEVLKKSCSRIEASKIRGVFPKVQEYLNSLPHSLRRLEIHLRQPETRPRVHSFKLNFPSLEALAIEFEINSGNNFVFNSDVLNLWASMPALKQITLKGSLIYSTRDVKVLSTKCPNVREAKIMINELQAIKENWLLLRKLEMSIHDFQDERKVLDKLKEEHQHLRIVKLKKGEMATVNRI